MNARIDTRTVVSVAARLTDARGNARPCAYTVKALIDAGLSQYEAERLVVDGPRATPEQPRVSLIGRTRGPLTKRYIWGPDAVVLLLDARWDVVDAREEAERLAKAEADAKRSGAR